MKLVTCKKFKPLTKKLLSGIMAVGISAMHVLNIALADGWQISSPKVIVENTAIQGGPIATGQWVAWIEEGSSLFENKIKILDTKTGKSQYIDNIHGRITELQGQDGYLLWNLFSQDGNDTGLYLHELKSGLTKLISNNISKGGAAIANGKVVWADTRNSSSALGGTGDVTDLYAYDIAKGQESLLVGDPGSQEAPETAGDLVVYAQYKDIYDTMATDVDSGIFLLNTKTGNKTKLTDNGSIAAFDGQNLIYKVMTDANRADLYSMNINTKKTVKLTAKSAVIYDVTIKNDLVIWSALKDVNFVDADLYAFDLATGSRETFVSTPLHESTPAITDFEDKTASLYWQAIDFSKATPKKVLMQGELVTRPTAFSNKLHLELAIGSKKVIVKSSEGERQIQLETAPFIMSNRTMVPIRIIAEGLGAKVHWNQNNKAVTIQSGDTTIMLYVGKSTAYINGKAVTLDAPAKLVSDRVFIPVRFVSEQLGVSVHWDNDTRKIVIYN